MINKKHLGNFIDVVAEKDYESGDIVQQGKVKGIAVIGAPKGEIFSVDTRGVFEFPHDGKLNLYDYAFIDGPQKLKHQGAPEDLFGVVVKLDGNLCWVKILQNFHQNPKKESAKS